MLLGFVQDGSAAPAAGDVWISDGSGNVPDYTSYDAYLHWDTANNRLGVNWTSPDETLDVNGNIKSRSQMLAASASAAAPGYAFSYDTDCGIYRIGTNTIGLSTNATERVRIDGGGKVGIGMTPSHMLAVNGQTYLAGTIFAAGSYPKLGTDTTDGSDTKYLCLSSTDASSTSRGAYIRFFGNEYSTDADKGAVHIYAGDGDGSSYKGDIHLEAGGARRVSILDSGNVGIGVTTPSEKLQVGGTIKFSPDSSTGTDLVIDAVGVVYKKSSSGRYKQNIRDLEIDPAAVLGLRARQFSYKATGAEDVGYIAEEVDEVAQQFVIYDEDERADGVQYDRISVCLVEVVKKMKADLDTLRHDLEAADARIAELESAMAE